MEAKCPNCKSMGCLHGWCEPCRDVRGVWIVCQPTKGVTIVNDPIDMLLWCPECGARHIDEGEFVTKAHHTHACQSCGMVWRPAIIATRGVQFLPGFKDGAK